VVLVLTSDSQLVNWRRAVEVRSGEEISECIDGGAQSLGSEVAYGLVHGPLDTEGHRLVLMHTCDVDFH
jgi:hypothetical protein